MVAGLGLGGDAHVPKNACREAAYLRDQIPAGSTRRGSGALGLFLTQLSTGWTVFGRTPGPARSHPECQALLWLWALCGRTLAHAAPLELRAQGGESGAASRPCAQGRDTDQEKKRENTAVNVGATGGSHSRTTEEGEGIKFRHLSVTIFLIWKTRIIVVT